MKSRGVLVGIVILGSLVQTAASQPNKKNIQVDAPPIESVLAGTSTQPSPVVLDLMAIKTAPEMPLGPQDILKSYEIAMSLVADKTSADLLAIVQAQQANQITREQAEYLVQQRYQTAMMQYQVLSALHDVLQHDINEATQQGKSMWKSTRSDTVLVAPSSGATSASR